MDYEDFLKEVQAVRRPATYAAYRTALQKYFPQGNKQEVLQVISDKNASPASKKLRLTVFKAALSYYGELTPDIRRLINGFREDKKVQPCPSKSEVQAMFKQVHGNEHKLAFMLMAQNGLRVSEVCGLKVRDVNLSRKTLILRNTKGHRDSVVPIVSPALLSLLQKVMQGKSSDDLLIGLAVGTVKNYIHAIAKRAGNLPYHAHSLRRYFANALMRAGVPIENIQTAMRHSSIETTRRYLNISEDDTRRVLTEVFC